VAVEERTAMASPDCMVMTLSHARQGAGANGKLRMGAIQLQVDSPHLTSPRRPCVLARTALGSRRQLS